MYVTMLLLSIVISLVQVAGCLDQYPLSEYVINITSELDSWNHPAYNISSLTNDSVGGTVSVFLEEQLAPDSAFSITVSAGNEVGMGTPSNKMNFCELLCLKVDERFLNTYQHGRNCCQSKFICSK